MREVIIVGAGASGIAAALQLADRGVRSLVVDAGALVKPKRTVYGNLYDYRERHDTFELLLGTGFQGLANVLGTRQVPVKLTAPCVEYVTAHADRAFPIVQDGFSAIQSCTTGGLANAWGAGLYRFTADDLRDFPIDASSLAPFFAKLTDRIGISGEEDDLAPYFGSTELLQPPLRLSRNTAALFHRYVRRRKHLTKDIRMGRARLGVLSKPMGQRPEFRYESLEFCQPLSSIYSPRTTLQELVERDRVDLETGIVVEAWRKSDGRVSVLGRERSSGRTVSFEGRHILLAAGAINTAGIVLRSGGDFHTELTLLENPAIQIPLVLPTMVGKALERDAFGLAQLNVIWRSKAFGDRLQGSIMELTGPMRAEFFSSLPFAARDNLALIRYLLPAMLLVQLFFPAIRERAARLSMQPDGRVRIVGTSAEIDLPKLKPLIRFFRALGAFTHRALVVDVPMGHAVHYAGTVPMSRAGSPYTCDVHGELHGEPGVFIADSASFPALPAKNMSFAMMANAMRIADGVAARIVGHSTL